MQRLALTGLLKIELPEQDVLLCDGGWIAFGGDKYRSRDPLFGTITSLEAPQEGTGDEVPLLEVEFAPPGTAAVADLSRPGYQQAPAHFWIAEYDTDTGLIVGTPELQFEGQVDQTTLRVSSSERTLAVSIVSTAEKLFLRNLGNSLSPTFHKSNNPGELGHDNATGLKVPIAWGVKGAESSQFSGFGAGIFNEFFNRRADS